MSTTTAAVRPIRLLVAQTRAELRPALRVPEYLVGVVCVPVILFAMFGLPEAGQRMSGGTDVAAMVWAGMSCYGLVSLAIFTFGSAVAEEREDRWSRRLRSTPMPMWAYFAAKLVMGLLVSVVILALTYGVALTAGVSIETGRLLRACGVLLLGTVAFSTFGYAIAYWFRPKAATAVANLIFLPLAFLSGFFMPLDRLPSAVRSIADYLPTYHFGQLVRDQVAATPQEFTDFGTPPPGSPWVHVAWVVGAFVVFSALTALGYRREARRENL